MSADGVTDLMFNIKRQRKGTASTLRPCLASPQDVVAQRYRRYAEEISVALQVALYSSHLRFIAVSVKAPAILVQAPTNE